MPIDWGCRIHQLLLCPGRDIKQSNGEVPVKLELWGMQSTPSLPSLTGLPWPKVVAPDRVQSVGQIELNSALILNWIVWNGTIFDTEPVYLCSTELFEIELFICIKIALALLTYNVWCAMKLNQIQIQISRECGVPLCCHYSLVHSDPKWLFVLVLSYIKYCRFLNAKSFLYIYIKCIITKHIL